jgi:hypothetical protein
MASSRVTLPETTNLALAGSNYMGGVKPYIFWFRIDFLFGFPKPLRKQLIEGLAFSDSAQATTGIYE